MWVKENIVFILGSQRSGTTLLCQLLGRHPDIAAWIEPSFIWDWYSGNRDSDVRTAGDASPQLARFVTREYQLYLQKKGGRILVDKTPENSFRIPCIHTVFPQAKWINIIRDGRDVVLSIIRELERRRNFPRNLRSFVKEFLLAMSEQPFWRNRFQEIWFEIKNNLSIDPRNYLNKSKWLNVPGVWGARFPGWLDAVQEMNDHEFAALQWVKTVQQIERDSQFLPSESIINVYYEELLDDPAKEMGRILDFLRLDRDVLDMMCQGVVKNNFNKWKSSLSTVKLQQIDSVQKETLLKLGYKGSFEVED